MKEKLNENVQINNNETNNAAFIIEKPRKQTWITDSGASCHVENNKDIFIKINDSEKTTIVIANSNT